MIRQQISELSTFSSAMLEKASLSTKSSDAKIFSELAFQALEQLHRMNDSIRRNSVLVFAECCAHLGKAGTKYPNYLEFCARNDFEIVSELDFDELIHDIFVNQLSIEKE